MVDDELRPVELMLHRKSSSCATEFVGRNIATYLVFVAWLVLYQLHFPSKNTAPNFRP